MRFPAMPVGCLRFIRLCFRRRKPNPFPSFELYPYRALVWPSMGLLGLLRGSGEGGGTEVSLATLGIATSVFERRPNELD